MNSLEHKLEWADYFAENLRIAGHIDASNWLRTTYGGTDKSAAIDGRLAGQTTVLTQEELDHLKAMD